MPDRITLEFLDGELPLNPNQTKGVHWSKIHANNRRWKECAYERGTAVNLKIVGALALASVHFQTGDERRHDCDNMLASLKPVWDGLVAAGVLQDDNMDYLQFESITASREQPRGFIITLREAP